MERFLDIILSTIGLLTLFPILLIVTLVLRFTGEKEIFYYQVRVGKSKTRFNAAITTTTILKPMLIKDAF